MACDSSFKSPSGLVRIPAGSICIDDPEEEVFLLYTRLSSRPSDSKHFGLGSVDSKQDKLSVRLEVRSSSPQPLSPTSTSVSSKRHGKKVPKQVDEPDSIEFELLQDKSILRSKKGDTGSVLWRVSVSLAQKLLFEKSSMTAQGSLLDYDRLRSCDILELGAGTGLLGLVISPWVMHYTATDLDHLVPLIRKNISANAELMSQIEPRAQSSCSPLKRPASNHRRPRKTNTPKSPTSRDGHGDDDRACNVSVEVLDWCELHRAPPSSRERHFRLPHANPPDIIIASDCVYNPALIPAFVATLCHYAEAGRTVALVVVELRASDVVQEFLTAWRADGCWEIWRLEGDEEHGWLGPEFAAWVGWKDVKATETDQN